MNAKKLGLAIGSVALVGAMAVGGSLAYLTANTNTATNVFTGDNNDLGGTVKETFDTKKASSYLPGDVITKMPTFTNDSDSIEAYVAVKVEYVVDGKEVSYADFSKEYATIDFNTEDWTSIAENSDSSVYMYNDKLAAKATSSQVFSNVTVLTGIETEKEQKTKTVYTYKEIGAANNNLDAKVAYIDENGKKYELVKTTVDTTETEQSNGILPSMQIVVTGYMVQAANQTNEDGSVNLDSVKSQLLDLAK